MYVKVNINEVISVSQSNEFIVPVFSGINTHKHTHTDNKKCATSEGVQWEEGSLFMESSNRSFSERRLAAVTYTMSWKDSKPV